MRFDDRLATVLAQPAADPHDRAVRWRQLIDLVARPGATADNPMVADALAAVREDWSLVGEPLRAAAARAIAGRQLTAELLALFAADSLSVSAPVLAAARLARGDWQQVLEGADAQTRRFVESTHPDLRDDAQEAPPGEAPPPLQAGEAPAAAQEVIPSISDVLARIERLRDVRERAAQRAQSSPEPGGQSRGLFRWECDSSGEIAWVEGAPRGVLIGRSLVRPEDGADRQVERAFAMRAPFRDSRLELPGGGAAGGEWKISGVPAFEPSNGRFAGYRGVATRGSAAASATAGAPMAIPADPDALRELVHEIRTPLNAIIGFAEIIDGQLLGPADYRYRGRAAEIVGQSRLLLAALEDLDLAAKLRSAGADRSQVTDLGELLVRIEPQLASDAADREARLDLARPRSPIRCAIDPQLAERLARRFLSTIIAAVSSGEAISLGAGRDAGLGQLWVQLPKALEGLGEEQIFDIDSDSIAPELRFALRLVRGLAGLAGGEVVLLPGSIALSLPLE